MAATGVSVPVDAPPQTPPSNGLLNSATIVEQTDDRWANGIEAQAAACDDAVVFDPCSTSADSLSVNRPAKFAFAPFAVEAFDKCSTFGYQRAEYEARARQAVQAKASKSVEKEFWAGALFSTNPRLAKAASTTTLASGAAQGIINGLAALVQAIGDYNLGRGMIHARPYLVTLWSAQGLLRWENGKLYTYMGNIVVPGTGYLGSAPDGTLPTTTSEWAYATAPVTVTRGPIEVDSPENNASSVSLTTNDITVRAQQMHGLLWNNCTTVAVNINPTLSPSVATYS